MNKIKMLKTYVNQFGRENQSENYLKFRPQYNSDFLKANLQEFIDLKREKFDQVNAIDLACGSGQLTLKILPFFDKVVAIDVNKKQLENLAIASQNLPEKEKLILIEQDCTLIDEILNTEQLKKLDAKFVFIAQAFHWFDYDEFLLKYNEATTDKEVVLVLIGYSIFKLIDESEKYKVLFDKFLSAIESHFQCNRPSLEGQYKEFDFHKYFNYVQFFKYDDDVKNFDIRNFLGYLDTFSAYRNYMEKVNFDASKDPLLHLMKDLGLKNYENKQFSEIIIPEGCPSTLSFKTPFFMYTLNQE